MGYNLQWCRLYVELIYCLTSWLNWEDILLCCFHLDKLLPLLERGSPAPIMEFLTLGIQISSDFLETVFYAWDTRIAGSFPQTWIAMKARSKGGNSGNRLLLQLYMRTAEDSSGNMNSCRRALGIRSLLYLYEKLKADECTVIRFIFSFVLNLTLAPSWV